MYSQQRINVEPATWDDYAALIAGLTFVGAVYGWIIGLFG